MQILFDRYEACGGPRHVDLATGELVDVTTRDVPDEGWRRRWRRRVDTLLEGCEGLERLVDAGEAGAHAVFEVRGLTAALPRPTAPKGSAAAFAIAWLEARMQSAGPCRAARLLADGRLAADLHTGWPVETDAERRAARASWRAWRALTGPAARGSGSSARDIAADFVDTDDVLDGRAGLVPLDRSEARAMAFARASDRVLLGAHVDPSRVPADTRARSCVIVGASVRACRAWSAALAAAGARRHFYVRSGARPPVLRERAAAYGAAGTETRDRGRPRDAKTAARLARAARDVAAGRLAAAVRQAGLAALNATSAQARDEAIAIKARALRLQGHTSDAAALVEARLQRDPAGAAYAILIEAAEAATDAARLEQGEAFARAAWFAARDSAEQARAASARDRARLWRGEPVEAEPWSTRAAWYGRGGAPPWPARSRYVHAPCGALARWEVACDRLEAALWRGNAAASARLSRQLHGVRARLPALLDARVAWLVSRDPLPARRLGARIVLQTGKAGALMEVLEHMSALLATCHAHDAEPALRESASRTRELLRARSVAIFAGTRPLPLAGDGDGWNTASPVAARAAAALAFAAPERTDAGIAAAMPIKAGGQSAGAVAAVWPPHAVVDADRARLLLETAALVMAPVLRAWLDRAEPPASADMPELVGISPAIESVRASIRRVARVPFPVLIEGESGVGKELVARAIHRLSTRAARPFRALNCAAMAEELVEAELFGHAQGAYTGAATARAGLFEDADRGTLFLDEVSELSPRAQAKLLRVLQESEVRRVGETAARRIDVRILAATNKPLRGSVEAQLFRADLSFRLDVLRITVPPLRDRPEDIAILCAHFWREAASRAGTAAALSADALGRLAAHTWPGNVRELQNVIAALAVAAPRRGAVTAGDLPAHLCAPSPPRITLQQARMTLERDLVRAALARAGGRPGRAAEELGVSRQGLAKLMRRLGLPAA